MVRFIKDKLNRLTYCTWWIFIFVIFTWLTSKTTSLYLCRRWWRWWRGWRRWWSQAWWYMWITRYQDSYFKAVPYLLCLGTMKIVIFWAINHPTSLHNTSLTTWMLGNIRRCLHNDILTNQPTIISSIVLLHFTFGEEILMRWWNRWIETYWLAIH